MRLLTALAYAAFATGAVAWEHHVDGHDEHKGHESDHVHAREADAMATQAWEHAHGGKAPSYKGFEEHGHYARAEPEFHHEPVHHQGHLSTHHARSLPHFDEADVDTSLEGYDLVARGEYEDGDETEGIFARDDKPKTWVPEDWKEQAWSKHLSHYSEHMTHTGTEHHNHPTNVARGIKEGWEKFTKKIDNGAKQEDKGVEHFGEEVKSFFARDADKAWSEGHQEHEHAYPTHHEHPQHTHAARGMPYEYAGHRNEPAKLHRPHEAREAEALTAHFTAHATHGVPGQEDEWTKYTAAKTAHPSKSTGGWGFPW